MPPKVKLKVNFERIGAANFGGVEAAFGFQEEGSKLELPRFVAPQTRFIKYLNGHQYCLKSGALGYDTLTYCNSLAE